MMRIELPLLGMINVFCSDKELERFASRQFLNYIRDSKPQNLNKMYVVIVTELDYDYYLRNYKKGIIQYSRDFKFEKDCIIYQGMRICQTENGKIKIEIKKEDFIKNEIVKKIYMVLFKNRIYAKYHALFYRTVLFPIFLLYTVLDNYFLIHGSLVKYKTNYFLISGLDGVGKSSLTNMLIEEGAECLSDNFVLFNGKDTVPLSLAMRISPDLNTTMNVIYEDDNLKEVVGEINSVVDRSIPQKVYLLCISDEFSAYSIRIRMLDWVLFLNNAPEIGEANKFISPFLLKSREETNKNKGEIDITILEIPKGQLEKGRRIIIDECQHACTG